MTNTGHEARTRAVLENLQRRQIHTKAEHLPQDIRDAIMQMVDRITGLEALVTEQAQTISTLTLRIIELEGFRSNVNSLGRELAEKAA